MLRAIERPRLTAHALQNVTVMPLQFDRAAHLSVGISAWFRDGNQVEGITLRRGQEERSWAPPRRPAGRCLPGRHVYGGVLFDHYGHFLVESLARYWYLSVHPEEPAVWHRNSRTLSAWQREIFEMLHLPIDSGRFITGPTEYANLVVPEPGFIVRRGLARKHADSLAVFPFHTPKSDTCVWLSRTRLADANVQGEEHLERLLEAAGWQVLHPETLSVREQLSQMSSASVIAGFEGSAFHTLLLAANPRARVVIVPRAPGPQGQRRLNSNHRLIANAKGLRLTVVDAPLRHLSGEGRYARQRLEDPDRLVVVLNGERSSAGRQGPIARTPS